jgi:hypothetical protein
LLESWKTEKFFNNQSTSNRKCGVPEQKPRSGVDIISEVAVLMAALFLIAGISLT